MDRELKFAFSDFIQLLKKHKKTLLYSILIGALACLSLALTRPVNYLLQATFRDKGKTQASIHSFTDMLISSSTSQDNEAISIMKSHFLLSKVVKELGKQGFIAPLQTIDPDLENARDNILAEWAYWANWQVPILTDPQVDLQLKNITYNGEIKRVFILNLEDEKHFHLTSEDGVDYGSGEIDVPFQAGDVRLTISHRKQSPPQQDNYLVVIEPMVNAVNLLAKDLVINGDRDDKSLLRLYYKNRDRHFGKFFLNTLMRAYQNYLEDDHELSSMAQLNYLEKRQKDAGAQLEQLMKDYVQNVSLDMSKSGFTSLQQEMDFLASNLSVNQQKLAEIKLEMRRLRNINCDDCVYYDSYSGRGDPAIINHLLTEIRSLRQHSDSLEIALNNQNPPLVPKQEYEGITLDTSRNLYLNLIQELNNLEAQEKQHRFTLEQLGNPEFEMSSLTALLQDPISHERIGNVSQLAMHLKDEDNRTQKELERLKEELALQKTFLRAHIEQMADLLALKGALTRGKISAIQGTTLALTQQQIALLKKQIQDYITKRIDNFKQEEKLLEEHQAALHERMAAIPPKWASEQLLNQSLALQQRFLENLASMVESKNISKNLEMIQSSPLDVAIAPIHPRPPRLLFFTFFGGMIGFLGASSFLFTRTMMQGVPASLDNLRLAQFHVSGSISPFQGDEITATAPLLDSDLDTLRRLIACFEPDAIQKQAKMVLIAPGKGPDFSNTLAKLLAKKGQTTLKMQLDFQHGTEKEGLLQYLEGKVDFPAIQEMEGFDWIEAGGTSRYSEELLRSPRFMKLLERLKPSYQWIIGVSPMKIPSAEAENLAKLFDGIVIVVTDEALQSLIAFTKTLDPAKALTCVTLKSS